MSKCVENISVFSFHQKTCHMRYPNRILCSLILSHMCDESQSISFIFVVCKFVIVNCDSNSLYKSPVFHFFFSFFFFFFFFFGGLYYHLFSLKQAFDFHFYRCPSLLSWYFFSLYAIDFPVFPFFTGIFCISGFCFVVSFPS